MQEKGEVKCPWSKKEKEKKNAKLGTQKITIRTFSSKVRI
jgi:hypothetical protein